MRVTIKDVAARAQVSQATVSRVLNAKPSVDEALRSRVLRAVQALGYEPNHSARRLRAQSSNVIGLIISDIQNPFFLSVINGIEDAARAHDMNIVLSNSGEDLSRQERSLRILEAERVAGLILVPACGTRHEDLERIQQLNIPVIVLDRLVDDFQADAVKVDNVGGAYNAVRHLTRLGHRRIGLVGGHFAYRTGRERYQGYVDALQAADLPVDPALVKTGDYDADTGYRLVTEFITGGNPPDALFTGNNLITLGALRALREHHVRVPDDMPLVSFDDMPWSGELYSPLTAISQPSYQLGQETVYLLRRRLAEPAAPFRTVVMETRLIVRESCGALLQRRSSV